MPLLPVTLDPSLIGRLLPWDLYTANGILVARAGVEVRNAAHFGELSTRPLFRRQLDYYDHTEGSRDPSAELRQLIRTLPGILKDVRAPGYEYTLRRYARSLIALSRKNHDALLGLARLMKIDDLAVRHCLLVAIIVIGLGHHLDISDKALETAVCAALTMNLAALRLHADLAGGEKHYNDSARIIIHHHPERSTRLLQASGIEDADWLDAVRQHHENLDGSGYPRGLHGADIKQSARLIRVADYFVAKITGRRNRAPKSAKFALRLILLESERERMDTRFAKLLLHRYGLYPSGTIVRLENREVAVVTRNAGRCGSASSAMSFFRQRGRLLAFPVERNIAAPGYRVTDVLERDAYYAKFPWEELWQDWS